MMTVNDLIKMLEQVKDKDLPIAMYKDEVGGFTSNVSIDDFSIERHSTFTTYGELVERLYVYGLSC